MPDDFIALLKTLSPEEWQKPVDESWKVKDIIAHMVGWEEECAKLLLEIWKTKTPPWFAISLEGDDPFNKKSVDKFGRFSNEQLISEWEKWIERGKEEVEKIGEENMRANPDLFGWWFEPQPLRRTL